ncbi:hypothetical protein ACPWSR_16865 [Alloiococcus sp. CFN-8]|uniref:hypothetical protein n=1 Tax=Alloiococcus sp. CFN-8 TaxID=3416081 RepID=UPI003CF4CF6B
MLFLFIKEYYRVESQKYFDFWVPTITEEISDWLINTWAKYQVNLAIFACNWINRFYDKGRKQEFEILLM